MLHYKSFYSECKFSVMAHVLNTTSTCDWTLNEVPPNTKCCFAKVSLDSQSGNHFINLVFLCHSALLYLCVSECIHKSKCSKPIS